MGKMKAVISTAYGGPGVLKLAHIDKPVPKANEVLVKVFASSATKADCMMRSGKPLTGRLFTGLKKPKHPVPGTGFAGIIEAVGEEVQNFKVGEKVFGETTLGFSTNAEYLVIPATGVILSLPENIPYTSAATMCDGPLTSINFLKNIAKLKAGQRILINGASGSLGSAGIQIASYLGAEVTGVCSSRNIGLVESLGADSVIDYTIEDFTLQAKHYDVIYDTVGKLSFRKCKRSLFQHGLYISPVLKFSLLIQMLITSMFGGRKAKFAATGLSSDEELRHMLAEVLDLSKEGRISTLIDRQFPLEKLADAHRYIDTGHKRGNVVILNQTEDIE